MLTSILIGLLGLGLVVIVHEYGHLLAAQAVGVGVDVFSVGWGKSLIRFKRKNIEYRISILPIGGFVRMKGEAALREAAANNDVIRDIPHGFFSAASWKRVIIAFGGPLANIIAAFLIFTVILLLGFTMYTQPNKIVLASEFEDDLFPADAAGLQSGDMIIGINDQSIEYFHEIREQLLTLNEDTLLLTIDRNGERLQLRAHPQLNASVGIVQLGVYPWAEPIIDFVEAGSGADVAGLMANDRILTVNDLPINHSIAFTHAILQESAVRVSYMRNGMRFETVLTIGSGRDDAPVSGIVFQAIEMQGGGLSVGHAMQSALQEISQIITLTGRGVAALFSGMRVTDAVAGPIQLTTLIGDAAKSGSNDGFWSSARLFFHFIALLNVALCIMNLLPIPVLDGGQIVLYGIESFRRKKFRARSIIRYQWVGGIFVGLLLILALTSDFLFILR